MKWEATEKIDGMSCRIELLNIYSCGDQPCVDVSDTCFIDGDMAVTYKGRTDRAQIPIKLLNHLISVFPVDKMKDVFSPDADREANRWGATLYGEGYGAKIQKGGGNYIPDGQRFILFDIRVGGWWLKREDLEEIAEKFDIPIVPLIGHMSISEAEEVVRAGLESKAAAVVGTIAEGLVLTAPLMLRERSGQRIITKIKGRDYK